MSPFRPHGAGKHPQQRTLASAIVTDQPMDFPWGYGQGNPIQSRKVSKDFAYPNCF